MVFLPGTTQTCHGQCFVIAGNEAVIRDAFDVDEAYQDGLEPSWNAAPMQGIPFVSEQLREGELVRRLGVARWGVGARMVKGLQERGEDD